MITQKTKSEVFVFLDETEYKDGEKLKGYVMLFVPNKIQISNVMRLDGTNDIELNPLQELFSKIESCRKKFNATYKFHFSDTSGKRWTKYNEAEKLLVSVGVDALKCKRQKFFKNPLYCKLAVMFFHSPTPGDLAFYGGDVTNEKKLRYNETILRMLLKGALHYLYDDNNKVKVLKIIADGEPYHRRLSEERILLRLINENLSGNLRRYVEISEDAEIIHQDSDHKRFDRDSNEYIYANILQLADMLLGSVVQSCLKGIKGQNFSPMRDDDVNDKKSVIAYPVKAMLDKTKRGINFKNSSHYKSFTVSKVYRKDGEMKFDNILPRDIEMELPKSQLTLLEFKGKEEGFS